MYGLFLICKWLLLYVKKLNRYVIKYCLDERIIAREYELI